MHQTCYGRLHRRASAVNKIKVKVPKLYDTWLDDPRVDDFQGWWSQGWWYQGLWFQGWGILYNLMLWEKIYLGSMEFCLWLDDYFEGWYEHISVITMCSNRDMDLTLVELLYPTWMVVLAGICGSESSPLLENSLGQWLQPCGLGILCYPLFSSQHSYTWKIMNMSIDSEFSQWGWWCSVVL